MSVVAQGNTAELVASYLEAIGTLAAVIIALFLQVILVRLRRPELSIALSLDAKHQNHFAIRAHAGYNVAFLGAKVYAKRRRRAARNVEAFLVKVVRPPGAYNTGNVPSALLLWSATDVTTIRIPSGTWRRLMLLRYQGEVAEPNQPPMLTPVLNLPLRTPFHRRYLLDEEGIYHLIIELSADDIDPTFWRISFTHTLAEVDDELHLIVSRLSNFKCAKLTAPEMELI